MLLKIIWLYSGKKEAMTCQWAVSYFGKVIFTEFNIPPLIMNNALEPARPGVRIPDVRFFSTDEVVHVAIFSPQVTFHE